MISGENMPLPHHKTAHITNTEDQTAQISTQRAFSVLRGNNTDEAIMMILNGATLIYGGSFPGPKVFSI